MYYSNKNYFDRIFNSSQDHDRHRITFQLREQMDSRLIAELVLRHNSHPMTLQTCLRYLVEEYGWEVASRMQRWNKAQPRREFSFNVFSLWNVMTRWHSLYSIRE